MTAAFIIAFIVAGTLFFLWQDEHEKRIKAEEQIKSLKKRLKRGENKKGVSQARRGTGPVTIEKSKGAREYIILKPQSKDVMPLLDQSRLAELQKQTKESQAMLAEIFIREEEKEQENVRESDMNPLIDFLGKLMTKEKWTRSELTELVGPDVMLGNLLEQVNDYAYTRVNDVVVEEDDNNIYITTAYKEQLI